MTVYRLQKDLEIGKRPMRGGLLVIDEFSMVGTPDLWQLLTAVPVDVDVLLVGILPSCRLSKRATRRRHSAPALPCLA